MSNVRTLRQAIAYSPSQNVKAQATNSSAFPVIDPRDWQGKTVPERQWFVEGWISVSFRWPVQMPCSPNPTGTEA
jgi:hypothetical protein